MSRFFQWFCSLAGSVTVDHICGLLFVEVCCECVALLSVVGSCCADGLRLLNGVQYSFSSNVFFCFIFSFAGFMVL